MLLDLQEDSKDSLDSSCEICCCVFMYRRVLEYIWKCKSLCDDRLPCPGVVMWFGIEEKGKGYQEGKTSRYLYKIAEKSHDSVGKELQFSSLKKVCCD